MSNNSTLFSARGRSPTQRLKRTDSEAGLPSKTDPPSLRKSLVTALTMENEDVNASVRTLIRSASGSRSYQPHGSDDNISHSREDLIASMSSNRFPEGRSLRRPLGKERRAFSRSTDKYEEDAESSRETRSKSRQVFTSSLDRTPITSALKNSEKKKPTQPPRISQSSAILLQQTDSEDSDTNTAIHVLRNSIKTVSAPHRLSSEEAQSSENEDVQEAVSAQLLDGVRQEPPLLDPEVPVLAQMLIPSDEPNERLNDGSPANVLTLKKPLGTWNNASSDNEAVMLRGGPVKHAVQHAEASPVDEDEPVINGVTDAELRSSILPPLAGLVSSEAQAMKRVLQGHTKNMGSDQEYLMRPALRQAKADCINAVGPQLDNSIPDPFDALVGSLYSVAEKLQPDAKNQALVRLHSRIFNSSYTTHSDGSIHFDNVEYESQLSALPRYRSIVRLGPNVLAKNDRTLKYMPYFTSEEDPTSRQKKELHDELQKRYIDRVETLPAQRKCSELAEFWRECVEDFLEEINISFYDIVYFLLYNHDGLINSHAELSPEASAEIQVAEDECPSCRTRIGRRDWARLVDAWDTGELPQPDETKLAPAGLACRVFLDIAKFSIWHIASSALPVQQLFQEVKQSGLEGKSSTLCLICHLHDCPTHGAYLEHASGAASASDSAEDSENDGEVGHNVRQRVAISERHEIVLGNHRCSIFCVDPDVPSQDILGLHPDGEIKGHFNDAISKDRVEGFDDEQLCSDKCFWAVQARPDDSPSALSLSPETMSLYRHILPTFLSSRRSPCLIALGLHQVSCLDVFKEMRGDAKATKHPRSLEDAEVIPEARKNHIFDHYSETSNTHALDHRVPFVPCSHPGPCDKEANCSCYKNRTSCERICGCSKDCGRRYTGCKCVAKGRKVCFQSNDCDCWRLNRECDPWICGSCGVLEVLDPVNRYDEGIQEFRCKNAKLQRDVPRRTLKGRSDVQGWGLFAGEDIKRHEYIGEYKGEIVGESESDRRGAVYHHRGVEYLFKLNKDQEIDSSRAGNKMRFINNSLRNDVINVEAKKMFCNGVQRIMLFSKKPIEAGKELFFNYGYPKSVTKNFWEPGEGPGQSGEEEHESDEDEDQGKGKAVQSSVYAMKQPRKKGIGRRITSKQQARRNGRWVRIVQDDTEFQGDITTAQKLAPFISTGSDANPRSQSRKKRKRLDEDSQHNMDELANPIVQALSANAASADSVPIGSSFHSAPEIAESDSEDGDEDVASEESPTSGDEEEEEEGEEEELDNEEEDDEDENSSSEVARRRRISAGDTRYGGRAQKAGWETRRLKQALGHAEEEGRRRPKKTRGQPTARGSYRGTGGRPRKRGLR